MGGGGAKEGADVVGGVGVADGGCVGVGSVHLKFHQGSELFLIGSYVVKVVILIAVADIVVVVVVIVVIVTGVPVGGEESGVIDVAVVVVGGGVVGDTWLVHPIRNENVSSSIVRFVTVINFRVMVVVVVVAVVIIFVIIIIVGIVIILVIVVIIAFFIITFALSTYF